jgi:ABC-type lipoprotein release transport system permease subunit
MLGVAFNRTLSSFLFDTPIYDLATILAVCGLLTGVCIAAIYFPARRAVHVDPIRALRCD